jgi:DNA-binding transcriptional MerR regulator
MMVIEKLYRIGEVMVYAKLSRQTVHNYTTMGLIREEKRSESGGHRLYSEGVFAELDRIKSLKQEGKTLLEIKEILDRERRSGIEEALRREVESETAEGEHTEGEPTSANSAEPL